MDSDARFLNMTTAPVPRLILKLAIPTIIIMLVSAAYNTADTYFVGRLGNAATGGVGVSFALMAIIQSLGFFFGQGSGNFVSRALGAKKNEDAEKMAATGLVLAFGFGCFLAIMGLIFVKPLAIALGSTETILPHAIDYMSFILIGSPFMVLSIVFNNLLRFQGNSFISMVGLVIGAVLNVALDPLFIFTFGLGVKGAAIATIISQFVGCVLLLIGCIRYGSVKLSLRNVAPSGKRIAEIFRGGTPSFLRQILSCIAVIVLNNAAREYGDTVIAAISVVNRIVFMSNSVMLGLGQGFQPVCGFNYGAKLYRRVLRGFRFCIVVSAIMLFCLGVICFFFAPQIIGVFRDDPEVIAVGMYTLRAQSFIMPLASWIILTSSTLQITGQALQASLLSLARQGIFQVPLLLILVPIFGVRGIQLSTPIADFLTFFTALPFGIAMLRKLIRLERAELEAQTSPENIDMSFDVMEI